MVRKNFINIFDKVDRRKIINWIILKPKRFKFCRIIILSFINLFQYSCCGIEKYNEWMFDYGYIPHSCCGRSNQTRHFCRETDVYNKDGCLKVLELVRHDQLARQLMYAASSFPLLVMKIFFPSLLSSSLFAYFRFFFSFWFFFNKLYRFRQQRQNWNYRTRNNLSGFLKLITNFSTSYRTDRRGFSFGDLNCLV